MNNEPLETAYKSISLTAHRHGRRRALRVIADMSFASCSQREISRKFRGRRRHVPYDFLSQFGFDFCTQTPTNIDEYNQRLTL